MHGPVATWLDASKICHPIFDPSTNRMNGNKNRAGLTVPFEKTIYAKWL